MVKESLCSPKKSSLDPEFERRGHREFFIDAIGELRIAWCSRPSILHKNDCVSKNNEDQYFLDRFGKSKTNDLQDQKSQKTFSDKIAELWYQRSHIKCSDEK